MCTVNIICMSLRYTWYLKGMELDGIIKEVGINREVKVS